MNAVAPDNLRVCHVTSGDLLAGKEVLLLNLAKACSKERLNRTLFALFNDGFLARKLKEQGAKVSILQEKGFPIDIQIIAKLAGLMKKEGIHVVHTHGYKGNVIGGIAAKLSGCPILIRTEHGKPPSTLKAGFSKITLFSLMDYFIGRYWTDKIVAVSSDLSKILEERYPSEKIITIYNGLDVSEFDGRSPSINLKPEFGITDENKLIGIFARLNPEKGIGLFLKAAKLISLTAPQIRFFIVGEGPLYDELKDETARLNLEKNVILAGFREHAIDLLCQMDVVVLSSVHEGMPMVLLEAMALRRPIVATAVGGIPEVIEHRKTGILVPPGDVHSLAMACLELIENETLAKQIGIDARKKVEKRFLAQGMLDKLLSLYQESLQKKLQNPEPAMSEF